MIRKGQHRLTHGYVTLRSVFILIAFVGIMTSYTIGQTTTGTISGTVTDPTGGVIPQATITATSIQTGLTQAVQSNSSGNYIFPALAPGDYTLSAKAQGFGVKNASGLHLDALQSLTTNLQLELGSQTESVTVTAAAAQVELREAQLSTTVDQTQIADLPLNGRAAYSLVQLVPGVTTFAPSAVIGDDGGTKFSLNGTRTNENSYYLDGSFDTSFKSQGGNIPPNPDALLEFRVLTNNFDAEYGRYPGAVVNVITRSGTNQFHGLAYDYLRNSALNLKNYFAKSVTPLRQNQFGGTFGGPIVHDKAFIFGSYEGLQIRTPTIIASSSIKTPTPAEAGGDFSALPAAKQPNVSCNGVSGVICPQLLDPVAQNLVKFVPLSDPTTGLAPQQELAAPTSANQYLVRLDYQLNSNHLLSGEVFQSIGSTVNPILGSNQILAFSVGKSLDTTTNTILSDVWTLSPNKLNTARVFYTYTHPQFTQTVPADTWSNMGSTVGYGTAPASSPVFVINGYYQEGQAGAVDNIVMLTLGAEDTFNWTAGNHQVKFGGSFFYNHSGEYGPYYGAGLVTFTGYATGNALADFLEGHAASLRQNNGASHRLYQPDPSLFAQDEWKIRHKLTLDLGVRWEAIAPFVGQRNFGTFSPYVQSVRFPTAPLGSLAVGDPGVPDGIVSTNWHNFVPRVGFAYDVFGTGRTAIHGGYGIFYATRGYSQVDNTEQEPFILDNTISDTPNLVAPYAPNPDPFPYLSTSQNPIFYPGATLSSVTPHAGFPYVQEYNLTVEQQLSESWAARIAYVGSVSRKFFISHDINEPVYAPGASTTTAGLNARRPYEPTPSTNVFGAIVENDDANNASYNALQATVTHRFSHGFLFLASYIWSKSIDISSIDPANITLTLSNQNNISADRARSDYDIPSEFISSYIWSVPGTKRWGFVGRDILSGWEINGITIIRTGTPFSVTSGTDSNRDGVSTDRPNVMGNPNLSGGRSRSQKIHGFFNTADFSQLPAGVPYGDASRNIMIGPGFLNTDLSAFKSFPVWKESEVQFRAEAFNTFNNVNLANPNGSMTSPLYGTISALYANSSPRIIQFALKYSF